MDNETADTELALLITNMRIYDVLMAILHKMDPDRANELLELHSTGALAGASPSFIGEFLTDKLNNLP